MTVTLEVPMVPNFVRAEGTDQIFDVAWLSDEEITDLAKRWRDALIELAKKRRGSVCRKQKRSG